LATLPGKIDAAVFADLSGIANRHMNSVVYVEKAVDVMLALDMVMMAANNEYDGAYLLSADGDYTPAVEAVRKLGKRVYAASPATGTRLARAANTFVRLPNAWFAGCMS
jgi:uncharacterized LabA/DUF88 family protein